MRFIVALDALRELAGMPIFVTSGYRCPKHNAKVPGAGKYSRHMEGDAADIIITGLTPQEMFDLAEQIPEFKNGGIGLYENRIHVDTRKGRARWVG